MSAGATFDGAAEERDGREPQRHRTSGDRPSARPLLLLLGLTELAALGILGWLPAGHDLPWPGLLWFAVAFGVYAVAAVLVRRLPPDRPIDTRTIWAIGIAMRVALLPLAPELSDDHFRYLWDGHVQLSGTNPYAHAPDAEALVELRTPWHDRINSPGVSTIYPPLAQLAFLFLALVGSGVVGMKLLWVAFDLATAWILTKVARATGRPVGLVLLLYLWAPLLVVEVAWSGHLESLGLFMLSLALLAAVRAAPKPARAERTGNEALRHRGAATVAGCALALSALTKVAPAAALPALWRRLGWRPVAGFVVTCAVLYVPYLSAGSHLFDGLRTYSEHWWFMKGTFAVLEAIAGDPGGARRLAGATVLGVVAWTAIARFDLERALLWVIGTGMIVTPTLHPWYVLWILPMAALRASRPWIALGGLAFIGYFGLGSYQDTGEWVQPLVVRAALWAPFFVLLALDAIDALRQHTGALDADRAEDADR